MMRNSIAACITPRWLLLGILAAGIVLGSLVLTSSVSHADCSITSSPNNDPTLAGVTVTCDSAPANDTDGVASAQVGGFGDTIIVNAGATVGQDGSNISLRGLGGDDTLINNGAVSGDVSAGAAASSDQITNTGSVGGSIFGNAGIQIISNSGSVAGNIAGQGGNDVINNSNMVTGNITNSGNSNITNSGTVGGGINLGAGADTVRHSGSAGNIDLNTGDDLLILVQGATVTGLIDGGTGNDQVQFQFTLTEADAAVFNAALANFLAANPTCGTAGADGCNGVFSFTVSGVPFNYNFQDFDQLSAMIQLLVAAAQAADSPALPPVPMVVIANATIKVFLLPSTEIEVYGGFSAALPNGFLIGKIPASARTGSECIIVKDPGGYNPGWYLKVCPLGNNRLLVQVFDQLNNFIIEFNNPSFATNSGQSATGATTNTVTSGTVSAPTGFTANPYVRPGQFGVALGGINLRETPSLQGETIGVTIPWGAFVSILEEDSTGYWFKVDYNGTVAWAANEWFAAPGQYRSRGGASAPTTPQN